MMFILCLIVICKLFAFDPDAALLNASQHGSVEGIKDALSRGAHMQTRNNFATTPLIFAANNGHLDAVKYLLDINADIEAISNNGRTPLLWACYWGHYKVVKYLISRGSNVDVVDFGKFICFFVKERSRFTFRRKSFDSNLTSINWKFLRFAMSYCRWHDIRYECCIQRKCRDS